MERFKTHDVTNQPPPVSGTNLFQSDPVLAALVESAPATAIELLSEFGGFVGSAEALELGRMANQSPPVLRSHDARGIRIDSVEHHPAYHALMRRSVAGGLHCSLWETAPADGKARATARAARLYLAAQADAGHLAAVSATNAAVAVLGMGSRLAEQWLPRIRSRKYDQAARPVEQKTGALLGLAVAEKQAGSDTSLLTTAAERDGRDGAFRLVGHKWFVATPMADALVVIAQAKEGPTAFLVPRYLPDGSRNAIRLVRLKDKLGLRSAALGEVEFESALAWLLGKLSGGVAAAREAAWLTRLDDAVIAAGLMRAALAETVHICRHRKVSAGLLIEQPLMARVLADIALDVAAATALSFRVAQALDRAAESPVEAAFAQLMTPVAKYWIGKSAPGMIAEAMDCAGGNAAVEESRMPRLYRDAAALMVADGPGNVLALDVVRSLRESTRSLDAALSLSEAALGESASATLGALRAAANSAVSDEGSARVLVEQLALTVAAATLHHTFPAEVGDAFLATRLGPGWRTTYGMLDARFDARGIIDFVCPAR